MEVINRTLIISNRKKKDLLQELRQKNYTPFPKNKKEKDPLASNNSSNNDNNEDNEEESDKDVESSAQDYDYLLSMPMWNLTLEKASDVCAREKRMNQKKKNNNKKKLSLEYTPFIYKNLLHNLQVQKLTAEREERETELNTLLAKTPETLWKEDLDEFLAAWDQEEVICRLPAKMEKKKSVKNIKN